MSRRRQAVCAQCGRKMNPVAALIGPVCGNCARKNHREAMRGGMPLHERRLLSQAAREKLLRWTAREQGLICEQTENGRWSFVSDEGEALASGMKFPDAEAFVFGGEE